MASIFEEEELSVPIVASVGSSVSLSSVLADALGPNWTSFSNFWLAYYGASYLQSVNPPFSYWDPSHPSVTSWSENGVVLTAATASVLNQTEVTDANVSSYALQIGSMIAPYAFLTIPIGETNGQWVYVQYEINVVAPGLLSPTAGSGIVNPSDIVASAERYAATYSGVLNGNDCANIASDLTAAAGAPLNDELSGSLDPSQNESAGFWRVVYRGSDPNPVSDWQTLVQPGDVVRMAWTSGGEHTTTILSVNADGSITVFDNADENSLGQEDIGIHTANYDLDTIPTTVTIFRLSSDHLYLINGTGQSEIISGNSFNDEIHTNGGSDTVNLGSGNNFVYLDGTGNNTVNGGSGFNTVVVDASIASASYNLSQGTLTETTSLGTNTMTGVDRVQFTDGVLALDIQGNAGNAYRLYQAAFDRTPDTAGLSFWIHALDQGTNIQTVAQDFTNSSEFQALYGGANPSPTTVVDLLYHNVLGRAPDQAGLNFWVNTMNSGTSVGAVLEGFAVSSENHALVDPKLVQGIVLDTAAFLV
jgi:hypothetical protein